MPVPSSPNLDLLAALQRSVDQARAHRKANPPTETRYSVCDHRGCRQPITITITSGVQRWADVEWEHDHDAGHRAVPEMRFAIDATCPGCDYPEIGFSPALEQFVCSRCEHTQTTRPKD